MSLPKNIRTDFPIFKEHPDLIYLDNAATTHKPQVVIDALVDFYTKQYATIHRGIYSFGEQATMLYEQARATVAQFIGADQDEIVFVKNATEGVNLVAYAWALQHITKDDHILLSSYEHHANLLPWQRVAQQTGATLHFIPLKDDGSLDLDALDHLVSNKTKLIAISAVSNVTGAYTDMAPIMQAANAVDAKVLVDAAQLLAHRRINVHELDIDFLVFSGHKLFGPTGIGALYIKKAVQDKMVPYQMGGGTIFDADWHTATYLSGPQKFEAGTPPIAQAIGLAAAIAYLKQIDMDELHVHEVHLTRQLIEGLQALPGVRILGPVEQLKKNGHMVSFTIENMHPHDVAAYLDQAGISVRAGHHCAQPLAKRLGVDASVRVSFTVYNTSGDVLNLLKKLKTLLT